MGDPVTTGILIGAAMGGGTAAIKGQDPLKAALIGGATGGIGGGFAGGFSGAAGAAPALGTTSAASGFAGGNLAAAQSAVNPTFMQQLSGGAMGVKDMFSGANTFMNQNPFTAQAGMSLAKSAFEPEQPMPYAPAGQIQRGQSAPPMDYMSLLNPQNQTVIRPQQISLLG
jgi:hypothetical protein